VTPARWISSNQNQNKLANIEILLYSREVTTSEKPRIADIVWEGDSQQILQSWPKAIRIDFGVSLWEMQQGNPARLETRRMESVGKNVFELKDSDDSTWYRMMYLTRVGDVIHVLDCFEKDSAKTEKKDLRRATARLSQVQQRLMEERKNAKRKANK
jgi:phage-related protein